MKQFRIKQQLYKELPFFLMIPALSWQVLFFYIPLAIVICLSFLKSGHLSFANYSVMFDGPHIGIVLRSFTFALFNSFICLICAYPVAYYLARKVKRLKNMLLFLLLLPFWTNVLVQIYAWFFVLERNGLLNTLLLKLGVITAPLHMVNTQPSVLLVMAYAYMPFMILPLFNTLEKLDERLIESSYDLGANTWQTFFQVTLPLSWSGIKTGFFLVFVPSFGEFVIPALMGGSKFMFAGSLISHYFLTVHDIHQGAAFTLICGVALLLMAALFNRYFSKKAGIRGK